MTEREKLLADLAPGTWGPVIWLPTVGSTSDYIKALGSAAADGTVVAADEQTAGRGRRGHGWEAGRGMSLMVSLLLRRQLPPALSLLCGLAAVRALEKQCGGGFKLKWPNDIVCGGKKIGGILCEARLCEARLCKAPMAAAGSSAVCGFGINLTQGADFFVRAGLPYAASVRMLKGAAPSQGELAASLLNALHGQLGLAAAGALPELLAEYAARCVTLGRPVRVSGGAGELTGTALRLTPEGALVVRTERGDVTVTAGEVSVRGMMDYL